MKLYNAQRSDNPLMKFVGRKVWVLVELRFPGDRNVYTDWARLLSYDKATRKFKLNLAWVDDEDFNKIIRCTEKSMKMRCAKVEEVSASCIKAVEPVDARMTEELFEVRSQ